MSFGIDVYSACKASIPSFDVAEYIFNKTRFPKSKYWKDESFRPLKNTASPHFSLRKHTAWCPDREVQVPAYSCRLFDTDIVTYYKPLTSGKYRVDFNITRISDMRYARLHSGVQRFSGQNINAMTKDAPYKASVYFGPPVRCDLLGKKCSASLLFDKDKWVHVDRSWHTPIIKIQSTEQDNALRSEKRALWYPFVFAAAIGAESLLEEVLSRIPSYRQLPLYAVQAGLGDDFFSAAVNGRAASQTPLFEGKYRALMKSCACFALDEGVKNLDDGAGLYGTAAPRLERVLKKIGGVHGLSYAGLGTSAEQIATKVTGDLVRAEYGKLQSGRIPVPLFPPAGTVKGLFVYAPE